MYGGDRGQMGNKAMVTILGELLTQMWLGLSEAEAFVAELLVRQ